MKYGRLLLVIGTLLPIHAFATQYACNSMPGWISVDAASAEEAKFLTKQRYGREGGCVKGDPSDVFVTEPWFRARIQLRPYLPHDIKIKYRIDPSSGRPGRLKKGESNVTSFLCDSSGGFLPDNSNDRGFCSEYESAQTKANWLIRTAERSTYHNHIFKQVDGRWIFWIESSDLKAVISTSPEAREYAAAHGFNPADESGQKIEPATTSLPDVNSVDNLVKKGLGSFLKGFGK